MSVDIFVLEQGESYRVKRLTVAVLLVFALCAVFLHLHRFYSRKFYISTGEAQWLWNRHRIASERPVVFFATREFEIPPGTSEVRVKVAADPEYVLYFNGVEMGGRRFRGTGVVDRYDVTKIARAGTNRMVVSVRSAKGVGGLLAAVDLGPMLENIVVSDDQWKLFHHWSDELLKRDPPGAEWVKPRLLGQPPMGRWDYLTREVEVRPKETRRIVQPVEVISFDATLPVIRMASGVAVVTSRPARARAYDFGPVKGRARLEVDPVGQFVARVRYVNHPAELPYEGETTPLPVAKGERVVVDPEQRRFRYVIVYDTDARATVLVEE